MKRYLKRILSLICIVSIVVTSLFIVPEAKAETNNGLVKKTLSDMGFSGEKTTYSTNTTKNPSFNFCGTELLFYASFDIQESYFCFGGSELGHGITARFYRHNTQGDYLKIYHGTPSGQKSITEYYLKDHFGTDASANFTGTEMLFRITIEPYDENQDGNNDATTVNVYIDGKHAATVITSGDLLDDKVFTFRQTITARDASKEESDSNNGSGLDRITLSDMGFPGVETTHITTATQENAVDSFVGKEIVFYASIGNNRYFSFGKGDFTQGVVVRHQAAGVADTDECFKFYHSDTGTEYQTYTSTKHFGASSNKKFVNQKLLFKITIDNDTDNQDNIVINFYIDNKHAVEMRMPSSKLTNKRFSIAANESGNITTTDARKDWADINIENFGMGNDTYENNGTAFSISKPLLDDTTLDRTNFEAGVVFHEDTTGEKKPSIFYGMTGSESWNGIKIFPDDETETGVSFSADGSKITVYPTLANGEKIYGQNLRLKVASEIVDSDSNGKLDDIKITASVNDSDSKELILKDYVTKFGTYLAVYCQTGSSMYLGVYEEAPDVAPSNLTSVTWENFGIGEKSYTDNGNPIDKVGVCSTITNIKNTSFRGKLKISTTAPDSTILYYGDTHQGYQNGINFRVHTDGTLRVRGNGKDIIYINPTTAGLQSNTFLNTVFELGIDLWIDDADLKLIFYINGNQYNKKAYVWEDGASYASLYNAISLEVGSGSSIEVIYPEQELEPSPENLVPITWANFGISATKTYLKTMGDEAGLTGHAIQDIDALNTLVGTSFRGKVLFNRQEGNLIICYGATSTGAWDGIRVYPELADGTLKFQGIGGDNPILATLDPAKTKLTSGTFMNTEFELGIDLWESDGDIKMNIFIEGVQYNRGAYVWADAATNGYVKKANNFVVGNEKNSLTVILPEPEYEASPEGLKKINWEDFGVTNENLSFTSENKTNDDGRHIIEMTEMQSVMETSFRGIITLDRNGSEAYYLCYGSEGANWSGIRMNLKDGNLKVECVGINEESSPTQKTFESIAAVNTGLTSFTDVPFELGIDIWEDGEDVKFNLFFNGKQYNAQAYVWEGVAEKEYFSNNINLIVKDEADGMTLALAEKVGCDIEATPAGYLLSGDTVRVDDILVTDNKTLTAKGDYHVLYVNENGAFARDISCYIPGDAHPDDEIDVRDLVATIKASQGYKLTTGVATWSADVNKDLSVDTIDSYLVRNKILAAPAASTVAAYSLTEDKSVMPIGGFSGPYGSLVSDKADEIYSLIRESGVNFLTFLPSVYDATSGVGDQSVFKQLELAEKNNLSVFVTDHDIVTSGTSWDAQKLSNRIRVLSKYKSFKGLSIVDEPRTNEYGKSDSRSYMSNYADASRSINMYANLSAYISAYPLRKNLIIDNNSSQEYTTVYENYLKEYCENFNPKYLSYDHYPFESGTNAITGEAIDTDEKGRYFENLAIIRKVANEENIPFWTMIQTGNYFGKEQIYSSDCGTTEGQFKWQVNVELAFGAKGIQYFPLVQPEGWEVSQSWLGFSTDENYKRHGFINAKGETTEMYTWAQEINTQIKAIDHVLMNSKSEGVMVTGKYATENMANLDKLEMPILTSYNNVVTGIATTGTQYGAIAGCFDYYGKTVLYVVNYDVKNPQTITLQFNGKQNATKITPDGKSSTVGGTTCEINLNAGEGTLLIF